MGSVTYFLSVWMAPCKTSGWAVTMMINLRRVDQASRMAARWLVKSCQISDTDDANLGAFQTDYDHGAGGFTLGPQTWHTSEAIRALLRIHARTGIQLWKDSAILGGRYLESVQEAGNGSEEAGSLLGPWLDGSHPLRVDTNYRSIGGLLDLYGSTGAIRYLEISRRIAEWFTRRAYSGGGTHLNRYFPDKKVFGWPRCHILDEGSFSGVYDLTREEPYASLLDDQTRALITAFDSSGMLSCRSAPRMDRDPWIQPGEISPRNMYRHLVPLLLSQSKRGSDESLDVLERGGGLVMSWQDPDGFLLKAYTNEGKPAGDAGPDGVATAMFVMVWLKLGEITGNAEFLGSAQRALSWMLESQSMARREEAFGAFFQERVVHGGRLRNQLGSLGSSYGILACEEYLRLMPSL